MIRSLILVRHAETAWNRERRYQGQRDIPLSTQGESDVASVRERLLKRVHLFDLSKTAVVTSDLLRAKRTAELLFGMPGRIIADEPGLREYHYGVFEGLTRQEIQAKYPTEFVRWHHDEAIDFAPPGGESRAQVRVRVEAAIDKWLLTHPHPNLVVVTHGGVLRQLLRKVREHAVGDSYDPPTQINYGNLAVHQIEIREGIWGYAGSL